MSPATLLLSSLLAAGAEAPLGPEARAFFGQQLAPLVARVRSGLEAKGITCRPGPGPGRPQAPGDDPATWLPAPTLAVPAAGGLQPAIWQVFLACEQPGKAPFRMGVGLSGTEQPVPRSVVESQGEGFAVRDIGADTHLLMVGGFQIIDSPAQIQRPPAVPPGTLARGVVALVAAEQGPGTTPAREVLAMLDAASLKAALAEIAALPSPSSGAMAEPARPAAPAYAAADEPAPAAIVLTLPEGEGFGTLERVLDADERGYFEALQVRLLHAMMATLRPLPGCELREPPVGSRSDTAKLTPGGFVPDLVLWVECGDAPRVGFHVRPLATAFTTPEEKIIRAAPDTVMLESSPSPDWQQVRLAIGALAAPPAKPRVVPGLMRLGAIECYAGGDASEVQRARALLSQLNLAPLRALLAAPPKPPASRRAATEGVEAKGERAAVEAEIYRAIFDVFGRKQVVVTAETSRDSLGEGFRQFAKLALPDLLPSALVDFDRAAALTAPFPQVTWRGPVLRFTAEQQKKIFGSEEIDGWKLFRERYPDAGAILTLSKIGLSRDRTQAVVSVAWHADWLAGAGEIWLMTRTAAGWRVAYKLRRWIS